MGGLPRVKVVNPGGDWIGTECYISGQKIERVRAVDFRVAVDEFPTFIFETNGVPEIDMPGDVQFSFTPKTVEEAKKILQNGCKNKIRIDIEAQKGFTTAYVDGEFVPFCERIEPDNEAEIEKIKFIPNKDALFSKYVQADLSSYTQFSVIVLRNELLKHSELYNGFLESIKSALDDYGYQTACLPNTNEEIAFEVLNRIIGEDKHED